MATKLEYITRCLSKGTHKKYENYVINRIYSLIHDDNLELITQQAVQTKEGVKYLDLYFPQIKVAIEVDEDYHDTEYQQTKDKKRMNDIRDTVISTPYDEIKTFRVKISGKTHETLHREIDQIVINIKDIIKNQPKPLEWLWGRDKLQQIKDRGYVERGDSFDSMVDILFLFDKNVKAWMKSVYKNIWSPTLSVVKNGQFTSIDGWVNTINEYKDEIYESTLISEKWERKKKWAEWDISTQYERYVFLKYKDDFGIIKRRFIGVFVATRIDENKKIEVWELKSKKLMLEKSLY